MNALYYNENLEPKKFEVIAENKDSKGTVTSVDIGVGKVVAVAGATIVSSPKAGCVTLVSADQEKAEAEAAKAADKLEKTKQPK